MNGIEKINQVIEYIEAHLTDDIICADLAKIATLSEYEFRRIFSFIIGIPVAEYIRKRRLSVAAEELKSGMSSNTDIAAKYGYTSLSSFTRAFKDNFNISPQETRKEDVTLNIYMKPRIEFSMRGGCELEYTEKRIDSFYISGVSGISPISDTCCCESVWAKYEEADFCESDKPLCAAYINGETDVMCYIGTTVTSPDQNTVLFVERGKWLCFKVAADTPERDVNDIYERILFSFLPSGIYRRSNNRPNLEIFEDDGSFAIMIPVELQKGTYNE